MQLQQQLVRQERAMAILQRLVTAVHKRATLPQAAGGGGALSAGVVHTLAQLVIGRAAGKAVRDALRALQEQRPEVGRVLLEVGGGSSVVRRSTSSGGV